MLTMAAVRGGGRRVGEMLGSSWLRRRGCPRAAPAAATFFEPLEPRVLLNAVTLGFGSLTALLRQAGGDYVADVQPGSVQTFTIAPKSVEAFQFGGKLLGYDLGFTAIAGLRLSDWTTGANYTGEDTALDTALGDNAVSASGSAKNKKPFGTFVVTMPEEPGTYTFTLDPSLTNVETNFGPGILTIPTVILNVIEPDAPIDLPFQTQISATPTMVPGDEGYFWVHLTNPTAQPLRLSGMYSAFMSMDDQLQLDEDPVVIDDMRFNALLRPGQTARVGYNFRVPVEAEEGEYRILGTFNFDTPNLFVDEDNFIASETAFAVAHAFGAVDGRPGAVNKLPFMDPQGTIGVLQIKGLTGTLSRNEAGELTLDIVESTNGRLKTKLPKGQRAFFRDINAGVSLDWADLRNVNLTGNANFGNINRLSMGSIFDQHTLTIGGTAEEKPISLSFDGVGELSIDSGRRIKSLTATSWTDADETRDVINTPSIEKIAIKGDFGADVRTTDPAVTLKKLAVKGVIDDASIETAGPIGVVAAGAMRDSSLYAGTAGATLAEAATDLGAAQAIKAVKLKGIAGLADAFVRSNIAGGALGKLSLGEIDPGDGGGEDFGVAGLSARSVQWLDGGARRTLKNLDLPGDADDNLDDDFVVLMS